MPQLKRIKSTELHRNVRKVIDDLKTGNIDGYIINHWGQDVAIIRPYTPHVKTEEAITGGSRATKQ